MIMSSVIVVTEALRLPSSGYEPAAFRSTRPSIPRRTVLLYPERCYPRAPACVDMCNPSAISAIEPAGASSGQLSHYAYDILTVPSKFSKSSVICRLIFFLIAANYCELIPEDGDAARWFDRRNHVAVDNRRAARASAHRVSRDARPDAPIASGPAARRWRRSPPKGAPA